MSNVTEFQFPSSTTEEEIDTDRQIQAALKRKSNNLRRRQDFLATCNLPEKFKGLKNADAGEIFAVLKSLRWRIHSATTKYNLSVAQRRRHSPRDKYMSFAGQNTTSLTLSRICLSMYCEGYSIKAQMLVDRAKKYHISRGRVYSFLAEAVDEGVFQPSDAGVYNYTDEALEHQFENMLRTVFNPETHELYKMLSLSYGLLEAAAMQSDGDTAFRKTSKTTLQRVMKLVDDED